MEKSKPVVEKIKSTQACKRSEVRELHGRKSNVTSFAEERAAFQHSKKAFHKWKTFDESNSENE